MYESTVSTLNLDPSGIPLSSSEGARDSLVDPGTQPSRLALNAARDAEEKTARSKNTLSRLQLLAKLDSLRLAIKVGGKILFIHLGDVVSIQAQGSYVLLQRD